MDTQTKVNVDFKPAKRMKKRRELDALVNGKQPPPFRSNSRGLRNGKHELLRNDSDSSEVEEFILPEKSLMRKQGYSGTCSLCITICWGFLLVVCLTAIGGLVWMCIQLKRDVDQLRTQLGKHEVGMKNENFPGEIHDIMTEQERLNSRLGQLESGDLGLDKLRENVTLLKQQVSDLSGTAKSLGKVVTNMPKLIELQSLPQQVKDLSKNIAELGSNLETTKQSVAELHDTTATWYQQLTNLDARLQSLQLANNEPKPVKPEIGDLHLSSEDLTRLVKDVSWMNATFYGQLEDLKTHDSTQQTSLLELYNYTSLLNTRVTFLEVKPTPITPSSNEKVTATIIAVVQNMLDDLRNSSKLQEIALNTYKRESTELYNLLQLQITSHGNSISTLLERLSNVSHSVADLDNVTSMNIEMLKSKLEVLAEKLKVLDLVGHLSSGDTGERQNNILPAPWNNSTSVAELSPLSSTPISSKTSSSSSLQSSQSISLSSPSPPAVINSPNLYENNHDANKNSTDVV